MSAPPAEALKLQRPLPDGALRIVAHGAKTDKRLDQDSQFEQGPRLGGAWCRALLEAVSPLIHLPRST
jgi:hypothetical protein